MIRLGLFNSSGWAGDLPLGNGQVPSQQPPISHEPGLHSPDCDADVQSGLLSTWEDLDHVMVGTGGAGLLVKVA